MYHLSKLFGKDQQTIADQRQVVPANTELNKSGQH